jgi:L-ascorbate metabolism protein UlaG (beta-lactamase superfamily)
MMRESHMNPEEALQAAIDLRAYRAMAMHFGTFDLSDEPLDEPHGFSPSARPAPSDVNDYSTILGVSRVIECR